MHFVCFVAINHPYLVASSLILISANPDLVLIPMRLLTKTAVYLVLLPLRLVALPFKLLAKLILWLLGFRASGVERGAHRAVGFALCDGIP